MDKPVIVVVATYQGRQESMDDHCSGGVCRSTQLRLGITGFSLDDHDDDDNQAAFEL